MRTLNLLKRTSFIAAVFSSLFLSGCAKSVFDNTDVRCPFTERGGCQSMEDINEMVTKGNYTKDGDFVLQKQRVFTGKGSSSFENESFKEQSKGKKVTLWVSPWRDKMDALHEASVVTFNAKHKSIKGRG